MVATIISIIPAVTKKSRPSQIIKVVADKKDVERLSRVLVDETGTLGVRVSHCERFVLDREQLQVEITVDGMKMPVKVKVAKDSKGKIVQIKPEFEDIKKIAAKTRKPLREISDLTLNSARKALNQEW